MTTGTKVTSNTIELSHGKTRYLEAGSGHPLLLVHGVAISGGADDWRPAIEFLSSHYRVIAPDCLGWPPGDTYPAMDAFPYLTDHLREFQDAMGIKSSHVAGATMGGWIAGLFGYESPNRVDKLILTGNPGFHGAPNDRLANVQAPTEEQVKGAIYKVSPMLSESERNELVKAKMARINEPGYVDAFATMMKSMALASNRSRFGLKRRLPHMEMPILFVIGRGDPTSQVTDEITSITPNCKLVIVEDGAHQVHYENAQQFSEAVIEFCG
jgi:pimeloyl-ACP methyl ester carboxylesterase